MRPNMFLGMASAATAVALVFAAFDARASAATATANLGVTMVGVVWVGVMGAFVFSAQMINFTIPGTGSSGHLGGGMILAVLLSLMFVLTAPPAEMDTLRVGEQVVICLHEDRSEDQERVEAERPPVIPQAP